MVRRSKRLIVFEKTLLSRQKLSYPEALSVFNALYEEARALGAFTHLHPLHGLDDTFRLARLLNLGARHG